jgi:hypothetical protein
VDVVGMGLCPSTAHDAACAKRGSQRRAVIIANITSVYLA